MVTKLRLEPLPAGDIRRLVQARLGVECPPEALVRLVTEKAEGNPLFAEEIVSFLAERGVLRAVGGKVEFDASAMATALPGSVQSLLTARVDRLAPQDRALVAGGFSHRKAVRSATVGRCSGSRKRYRFPARRDAGPRSGPSRSQVGDYSFKHALVRDALYQSLLTEPRVALHLKIAEEVERRSDNRLTEVAEMLAHHYSQTDRADKAFAYLALAGAKSLGVYSLDEAENTLLPQLRCLKRTRSAPAITGRRVARRLYLAFESVDEI